MKMTEPNASLSAKRLKEMRDLRRYSLAELSNKTNISKTALHRYEKEGILSANVEKVKILCDVLGGSVEWLLGMDVDLSSYPVSEDGRPIDESGNEIGGVVSFPPSLSEEFYNRQELIKKICVTISALNSKALEMIDNYANYLSSQKEFYTNFFITESSLMAEATKKYCSDMEFKDLEDAPKKQP